MEPIAIMPLFLTSFHAQVKGIVSRDWGGLLLAPVDKYKVLDITATYLFLISMSST
jgi:hypothetical protein